MSRNVAKASTLLRSVGECRGMSQNCRKSVTKMSRNVAEVSQNVTDVARCRGVSRSGQRVDIATYPGYAWFFLSAKSQFRCTMICGGTRKTSSSCAVHRKTTTFYTLSHSCIGKIRPCRTAGTPPFRTNRTDIRMRTSIDSETSRSVHDTHVRNKH